MISEHGAMLRAVWKMTEVFGLDYIKAHLKSPACWHQQDNIFTYTYYFQNRAQRPDLEPNEYGWTVFATVTIDLETGEANFVDYILPDGTKMPKPEA